MKEIEMIKIQQEHIDRLQKKLDDKMNDFIDNFTNISGWFEFLLRNTVSYYRPKNCALAKYNILQHGTFKFSFDDKNNSLSFDIKYGKNNTMRTMQIPFDVINEFIENNKQIAAKEDGVDYSTWTSYAWSTYKRNWISKN